MEIDEKSLEDPGIDPGASRMLSGRSTIWARLPSYQPLSPIPLRI